MKIRAVVWRPLKAQGRRLNKRRSTLSRNAKRIKKYFLKWIKEG